jgi:hypothetical protein
LLSPEVLDQRGNEVWNLRANGAYDQPVAPKLPNTQDRYPHLPTLSVYVVARIVSEQRVDIIREMPV